MRNTVATHPGLVIEAVGVDHECIAFPVPDGVTRKTRKGIGFEFAPVEVDHPPGQVFIQDYQHVRCLHITFPAAGTFGFGTVRQAGEQRASLVILHLTLTGQVGDPWLQDGRIEICDRRRTIPQAGEIGFSVDHPGSRGRKIRSAVRGARNTLPGQIQPLGYSRRR